MQLIIDELMPEQSCMLITALEDVLNARTHTRIHMGEPITVPGSLAKALKLPELKKHFKRKSSMAKAKRRLDDIWQSMSQDTRDSVLDKLQWYDPKDLDWEDPRSNRKPI